MFLIESKMIKNNLRIARQKLEMHYQLGMESKLSIFEVANLKDLVLKGESVKEPQKSSIFFSFSVN